MLGIGDKVLAMLGGGLSAVLAIALLFTVLTKNSEIKTLKDSIEHPQTGWRARLDACNADRLTLKANQGTLEAGLAKANSSISDLQAAAATKYSEGSTERARASEAAQSAATRAQHIAIQRAGPDQCASADQLILENVR